MTTAILQATLEAFAEGGFEAVKFDAIAEQAGVHKTTVYRRWPTRGALLADALATMPFRPPSWATPDTGSLRGDLLSMTAELEIAWREPRSRRIARNLAAAAELAAIAEVFWSTRVELVAALVTKAIERGEVPRTTDPGLIATLFVGTLKFHAVDRDFEPPHDWFVAVIEAVARAAGSPP